MNQDHLVRGRQFLWRGALKPKTKQGPPDRLVCVCVSAWNLIACKGGVRDPHLGQEVRNCQGRLVVDMEAAWVPIMVRCTPPGETPAEVSAEQALTSAIRGWTRAMLTGCVNTVHNNKNENKLTFEYWCTDRKRWRHLGTQYRLYPRARGSRRRWVKTRIRLSPTGRIWMGTREPSIRLVESVDIRPRGSPLVEVGERGEWERVEGVVDHGGGRKRGQCGRGDGYKRGGILRGGVKSGDGWKEMTALRAAVPSYHTRPDTDTGGLSRALISNTHATSIQISLHSSDLHSDSHSFLGCLPDTPFLFLLP